MKKKADKHKARNLQDARRRAAWLIGKSCAICGCRASEIHHIAGRNAKAKNSNGLNNYEDARNWLPICNTFTGLGCHEKYDKESPAVTVCAAKMRRGELDLEFLKGLRPGRRFAITSIDIANRMQELWP